MKINRTLVFSIIIATGIVAAGTTYFRTSGERQRLNEQLRERAANVILEIKSTLSPALDSGNTRNIAGRAGRICSKYRLYGFAFFNTADSITWASPSVKNILHHSKKDILFSVSSDTSTGRFIREEGHRLYQYVYPVKRGRITTEAIVLYIHAGYINSEILGIWMQMIIPWLVQAFLVALITILILRWRIFTPLEKLAHWMMLARAGNTEQLKQTQPSEFLSPVHKEATRLAEAITEARAAAEEEAVLRTQGEAVWTPERLNAEAGRILKDKMLIVVSNREPYMHIHEGKAIKCIVPASGMVTAMEPILKACGGLWIATGSGEADKEVVDDHDKIKVPPEDPKYTLRRIWISREEEEHYYYGFANEGMWPLCHVAHTRPVFREEDWKFYKSVNRKFADSILGEIKNETDPFILVQDYHFALLPAMIKESRPDARVSIFWHIPWPNPESFGICPWQEEIVTGMLGADLIGFHTQYHCNNFLSTINRALEARVTWENFSVTIGDHTTRVNPFPISIEFTMKDQVIDNDGYIPVPELLKEYGIKARLIGVGVDRIDYTKGILERFRAVERFLEKNPEYQNVFTFVQIGAPSRTFIKSYSDLVENVELEAQRINKRFQTQSWKPVLLMDRHHSHEEILPFYKAASLCMVTSLHDGMNLVAKEFVASRSNNKGSLILSRFTGAAQELSGSILVNPYDIEEMADSIRDALEMPVDEQQQRMMQMRQIILENNIYSWAANLLRGMVSV